MNILQCHTLNDLKQANYIRSFYNLPDYEHVTSIVVIIREAFLEHEVTFKGTRWTETKIIEHCKKVFQWK